MAPTLTLEWDQRDLAFWKERRLDKALARALKKAGSNAIRGMKSASTRSVRQRKSFKVARVNKALTLTYPKGNRIDDLVWRMHVSSDPVPVASLPHRQTRRGVTVKINQGKRKLIKGAFVARMSSGHKGVFQRTSKKSLPIREAFTTRITDVFKDEGMIPAVQARAQRDFRGAFARLFAMELGKARGG